MFGLSDLAGYWGSVMDFGGVAYTAHLGGEAAALLIGGIVYVLRFRNKTAPLPLDTVEPIGKTLSLQDMVDALRPRSRH